MMLLTQGAFGQGRPGRVEAPPDPEVVVARVLTIARSQLGPQEIPGHRIDENRGEMVDVYNTAAGGALGSHWCAAFVSWVMGETDKENQHQLNLHKLEGLPQPPDFEKRARELGVLREPKQYMPLSGDLLIFRWPNGYYHLEMVTGPEDSKNNLIPTIGGNAFVSKDNRTQGVRETSYKRHPDGGIGYREADVIGIVDIRALMKAKLELPPKSAQIK